MDQSIEGKIKKLTICGISRISYPIYDIEVALEIIGAIGLRFAPKFVFTQEARELYVKLIQYFYSDGIFPGELTKGLILQGPTGTGKTLAMKVMSEYLELEKIGFRINGKGIRMKFSVVNVNDIVNGFMQHAFDGIQTYIYRNVICLDDIGTEMRDVKHFGNSLDVIGYIISERYNKGNLTFATTNYPKDNLENIYPDRIVSRINEMFNFITVKGDDLRKNSPHFK
jgi:DNA replication protein DnaC